MLAASSGSQNVNLLVLSAKMKIVEKANSLDPDEVAHYEPPHLDQQCLPSSFSFLSIIKYG